jgi:hypothetical protein
MKANVAPPTGEATEAAAVDADETEMEIRHVLYHLGADLGDPITVGRGLQDEVVVEMLGVTAERVTQVEELLHRYPSVILDRTGTLLSDRQSCDGCFTQQPLVISGDPAGDVDPALMKHFGGASELQAFAHEILSLSDKTMAHAYALKGLASRYDDTAERSLQAAAEKQLSEMIAGHAAAMAETALEVSTEIRPVLRDLAVANDSLAAIAEEHTWQKAAVAAFNGAQAVDRLLKSAFAATNSTITASQALQRLPAEISTCDALLAHLRRLVEKEPHLK